MADPKISVVVPCYNAQAWIQDCLQSIVDQDVSDMEIIVVDDGSTDASAELIQTHFPQVHLIQTPNQGPSQARNLGTQAATGRWIQYVDADDWLAPNKLKCQLEALEASGADVAYGAWERRPVDEAKAPETVSHEMTHPETELFRGIWCPPAVYLFRKEIVDGVGGWNEQLPVIQDARFVWDCAFQGAQFVFCPELMAYYREHTEDSVSTRNQEAFLKDCLLNAEQVHQLWVSKEPLNEVQTEAFAEVYLYVAKTSDGRYPSLFEQALSLWKTRGQSKLVGLTKTTMLLSKIFGFPAGERLAARVRGLKGRFA